MRLNSQPGSSSKYVDSTAVSNHVLCKAVALFSLVPCPTLESKSCS